MYNVEDFLEMFNNDDLDVERYFNDYSTWFNILKKRGLMGEVDPHNASDHEVWQNEYLLWLLKDDKPKFYEWVNKLLGDFEFDENGNGYLILDNRGELSRLFCDGRRYDLSQETVSSILGDDSDVWEPYWDTTDNVYRDVIEELSKENLEVLKKRIIDELKGKELSPETEEMEFIAEQQGHPDYWVIDETSVERIIDDESSMKILLNDELSDMRSELYSIHSNAYNSAYQEEVYEDIWKELTEFFDGTGEWISVPNPYKKDTTLQKFKIKVSDPIGFLGDYLYENKKYGNSGTIEYHGSYIELLKETIDCLSAKVPEYPDFRKVDKNINLYFGDHF
jgi:hypothetical protein